MKQYRYIILLFLIACIPRIGLWAQSKSLGVEIIKDSLKFSARQLHFLSDKELEQLHNGSTVTLIIDLTVVMDSSPKPIYHALERFTFSFDLWEEKYSVYHSPPDGRYVSHLSAASAEEWCLKNMSVPLNIIPDKNAFVIQLECFIEENHEENNREDAQGLLFEVLIEYFSREKSEGSTLLKLSTGLLRLDDLK